jgi:tetratricopeptide (TPR) repeat protein
LNRIAGWYGYSDYGNPYYDGGGGGYSDYSEPVCVDASQAAAYAAYDPNAAGASPLPPGVSQESFDKFDQARGAFYNGQYPEALKTIDDALTKMPKDAVMHEFRALCLFALQRYKDAAAVMNAVLAVGPGWDWTTLSGMYADPENYTAQLRALEAYVGKNPNLADGHFLAAYHYITIGQNGPAIDELKKVVALQPKDSVAAYLLQSMSPSDQPSSTTPSTTPVVAVANDAVVGTWTASGAKNAKYEMTLAKDGAFSWSFTKGGPKQEVKGAYAIDGNSLAMQPDGGGTMLMELKKSGSDSLHADIVGAAKGDPGLNFKRTSK